MLSKVRKRYISLLLVFAFLFSCISVSAENNEKTNDYDIPANQQTYYFEEYENYLNGFSADEGKSTLTLDTNNVSKAECEISSEYSNNTTALKLNSQNSKVQWKVNVDSPAFYEIYITYLPFSKKDNQVNASLSIDGEYPYSALRDFILYKYWKNSVTEFETDKYGDHIAPEQVLAGEFITSPVKDTEGIVLEPYRVYLSSGEHTIEFTIGFEPVALKSIELVPYKKLLSYNDTIDTSKTTDKSAETIYIEGEEAAIKSSRSLVPKSDTAASLTPVSASCDYLNYIGGTSWQSAGDTLLWNFDVKASGYYKIAFNYMQNDVINAESLRKLKIDGKVPFKEFSKIGFDYCSKWQYLELTDENDSPYYVWLDKGPHTISLEVTLAEISEYYKKLHDIVNVISEKYMEIVMITGDTPDINRDYDLFNQIPDLKSTFTQVYDNLSDLSNEMEKSNNNKSNQYVAAFNNMLRVIKSMLDSPYMAHQYVKDYYTNYCTVSSWLYDMMKMPVRLDQIQLVPKTLEYPGTNNGFLNSILHSFKRFVYSFTSDYNQNASNTNETELELWVNWGIDQSKALTSLIQQSFTKDTGIKVNVRVTNASLVKGILSNNYPDISLHLARTEPVNLGIRGALYDLKNFEDYDEVLKRFNSTASIPYTYNDKAYALPDQQAFYIMFYRTDILEELGIAVPTTWDEFIRAATILQRKNLQIYIPYTQITTTTTVNTGIGALNLYPTLMAQNEVSIYNDDRNACQINTDKAVSVFKFWTRLYTDYKYVKQADFYNRFRVGTMPLGIAPYTTYMTLEDAAPEIKGKWSIACVPGVDSGSSTVAGSGTGCGIVSKSSHKKEAWEFLKWWTSAETQLRYSNNVESMLGAVGRQYTSNVEAFTNMSWDTKSKEILLEQWSRVEEVPEIPGSYYLTRAIDQAYFAVLNNNEDYQTTMDKWNDIANGEISRKIEEYK